MVENRRKLDQEDSHVHCCSSLVKESFPRAHTRCKNRTMIKCSNIFQLFLAFLPCHSELDAIEKSATILLLMTHFKDCFVFLLFLVFQKDRESARH